MVVTNSVFMLISSPVVDECSSGAYTPADIGSFAVTNSADSQIVNALNVMVNVNVFINDATAVFASVCTRVLVVPISSMYSSKLVVDAVVRGMKLDTVTTVAVAPSMVNVTLVTSGLGSERTSDFSEYPL